MAWRKLYPVRGNGWAPRPPRSTDRPAPRLAVGAAVRLGGKPDLVRRVLAVEWHGTRRKISYILETSAPASFQPYWFTGQIAEAKAEPGATDGGRC